MYVQDVDFNHVPYSKMVPSILGQRLIRELVHRVYIYLSIYIYVQP